MHGVIVASGKLTWYIARSSGLVAWAVMTSSVVLGLATAARLIRRKGAPAWMLELHKFLGILTLSFTAIHVAALVADNFVHFGWTETLVPLTSSWRRWGVGWGVTGMYLLAAVEISSWMMQRIPRRIWYAIHLASIPMLAMTTAHGLMTGADRASLVVQWVCLTSIMLSVFTVTFRALSPRKVRKAAAKAARAATPKPLPPPDSGRRLADELHPPSLVP